MDERRTALFRAEINDWRSWGAIFQTIPAFYELLREIYRRERLPFDEPQNLTPGTNAVFRVGGTVAKVFFPCESGLDPERDFLSERAVAARLERDGVPTPRVLASGLLRDKYDFFYIITEFFDGVEAGDYLARASDKRKREFAASLRAILDKLNRPADGLIEPVDLVERAVENPRLALLPERLRAELRGRARAVDLGERVLVHGDLTGENLLVGEGGELVVIDCADACLAPSCYELAPIVFELFRCDGALLREFSSGLDARGFVRGVLDGLSLHDFGGGLISECARRERREFASLGEIEEFLLARLGE